MDLEEDNQDKVNPTEVKFAGCENVNRGRRRRGRRRGRLRYSQRSLILSISNTVYDMNSVGKERVVGSPRMLTKYK